jgi:transposase
MDKGYDRDAIRAYVNQLGATAVIALHPSRSQNPPFDQHPYRERHRIENLFARLKQYRRICTRCEKLHSSLRRHALTRLHPPLAPILTRHPLK